MLRRTVEALRRGARAVGVAAAEAGGGDKQRPKHFTKLVL